MFLKNFNIIIVALHCSGSFCCVAVTPLYIYTFFFSYYLPSWSITSDWIEFPVLYSRTSVLIHSKWNSFHLLTSNSPSMPLPPSPPWQPQVCSPCL